MSRRLPIRKGNDCNRNMEQSYLHCRELVKKSGSNFYYGMWLTLNKEKRDSLFAIYAWMRAIDDIADSDSPEDEKIKQLNDFYRKTEAILNASSFDEQELLPEDTLHSFWPAFQQTIIRYNISFSYFHDMFVGQLQSIQQNRYENFLDLYQYCYRVAASVGLACIAIWGYKGGELTQKMAEYRGIALQLTNVVRDVSADAKNGKLFIPLEWVEHDEDISHQMVVDNEEEVIKAVNEIISQAEHYYEKSRQLERHVSRTGSLSLRVMTKTYFSLLKKIKKNPQLILENRKIKLNRFEKLSTCFSGIVQWCVKG